MAICIHRRKGHSLKPGELDRVIEAKIEAMLHRLDLNITQRGPRLIAAEHMGARGHASWDEQAIEVEVRLPMLLAFLRTRVENTIDAELDRILGA